MLILEAIIPYPTLLGKRKKSLITLNNYKTLHWSQLNEIKNLFKKNLKSWYLIDFAKKNQSLIIEVQAIRHTKRKLDAVNMAFVVKWLEDVLTELQYVSDDDKNTIILRPSTENKNIKETLISVKIYNEDTNVNIENTQ